MSTAEKFSALIFFFLAYSASASDETVRIITWNVEDATSVESVRARERDFLMFAQNLQHDLILLQEVTSEHVVKEIRNCMNLENYFIACSDFVKPDSEERWAFEVALISKFPITEITEYDPEPDGFSPGREIKLDTSPTVVPRVATSRGFLRIRIESIEIIVIVVHLKSSLGAVGREDGRNASKREFVATGVALCVVEDKENFPDYAIIVAGDFNVGYDDRMKNGINLNVDHYKPSRGDLYDETHAILGGGLIDRLYMKNLTASIRDSTFRNWQGSPIDNIYVDGHRRDRFEAARKAQSTYGSDHYPVWTDYHFDEKRNGGSRVLDWWSALFGFSLSF